MRRKLWGGGDGHWKWVNETRTRLSSAYKEIRRAAANAGMCGSGPRLRPPQEHRTCKGAALPTVFAELSPSKRNEGCFLFADTWRCGDVLRLLNHTDIRYNTDF